MEIVNETRKMLGLTAVQFADLTGTSYTTMSNILENTEVPSEKLIKSCKVARQFFLKKNDTLRVNESRFVKNLNDKKEGKNNDIV